MAWEGHCSTPAFSYSLRFQGWNWDGPIFGTMGKTFIFSNREI